MSFTAHNIEFDDGTKSMPELDNLTANTGWMRSARRVLAVVYGTNLSSKSIIDLGCLEGGYSVEFARLGMTTVGLEVRESNFKNCMLVQSKLALKNLSFVKDNAWNFGKYGNFDVSFCCGLLYHLDRPAEFINYISNYTNNMIILNTHYALEENTSQFNLSSMTTNEGFRGRWFVEHDLDDEKSLEEIKWASWENKRSFWLTKQSIMQILYDSGFDMVFEQVDILAPDIVNSIDSGYYSVNCRSMFVGIRSNSL